MVHAMRMHRSRLVCQQRDAEMQRDASRVEGGGAALRKRTRALTRVCRGNMTLTSPGMEDARLNLPPRELSPHLRKLENSKDEISADEA